MTSLYADACWRAAKLLLKRRRNELTAEEIHELSALSQWIAGYTEAMNLAAEFDGEAFLCCCSGTKDEQIKFWDGWKYGDT